MTLKIDRDVWEQCQANERSGMIGGRTGPVNRWIREKLAEMKIKEAV